MNHTVYITTNIKNGNFYIGKHSTNNLNDGYQGSGYWVKNSKKLNAPLFTKIIDIFKNEEEAFEYEKDLIELCWELFPEYCKNIQAGGVVYNTLTGKKNPLTPEQIAKRFGRTPWNKGKKLGPMSPEQKEKLKGRVPWNKGKTLSPETREKISNANKGQTAWNKGKSHLKGRALSEEHKRKIGLANKGKLKGRIISEEHKDKIRESNRRRAIIREDT